MIDIYRLASLLRLPAVLERAPEPLADEPSDAYAPIDAMTAAGGVLFVDSRTAASRVKYSRGPRVGQSKRDSFPRLDRGRRRGAIVVHRTGFDVQDSWPSWHRVTGHYVVTTAGRVVWNHPHDVRLIAGNWWDERPWAPVHIEVAGDDVPATDEQLRSLAWCVRRIVEVERDAGRTIERIGSHRQGARPGEKPGCPGVRIWRDGVLPVAAELGIGVSDGPLRRGCDDHPRSWRA